MNKAKEIKMWIGVDPVGERPVQWSLATTRKECRSTLDWGGWGGGRVRRVTLIIEPGPKKETKHGK